MLPISDIFKVSIIAFMFHALGEKGMIFNFYFAWLERRKERGLPEWLYKPLGGCEKCWCGQVLFHFYWITCIRDYSIIEQIYHPYPAVYLISHIHNYDIIDQLFYPSLGIFLTVIYTYIYERASQN